MDLNLKMEEEIQIEDDLLSVKILEILKLEDNQQSLQIEENLQSLQIEENENLLLADPGERFTVIRPREKKREEPLLLRENRSFSVKMDSAVEGLGDKVSIEMDSTVEGFEEKIAVKKDSPVEGLEEKVSIELEECAFSTYAFLMDNEKPNLEIPIDFDREESDVFQDLAKDRSGIQGKILGAAANTGRGAAAQTREAAEISGEVIRRPEPNNDEDESGTLSRMYSHDLDVEDSLDPTDGGFICILVDCEVTNQEIEQKNRRIKALLKKTGARISKIHGQRHYKHPELGLLEDVREAEVYCYNLPDMCFEDELVPFFSKAGTIQKLRILVHFSGFTKTHCYVRYMSVEDANKAVNTLNSEEIRPGKPILLKKSQDRDELLVYGLLVPHSAEYWFFLLGRYCKNLTKVEVVTSQDDIGYNLILLFKSHQDASQARRVLVPSQTEIRLMMNCKSVEWGFFSLKSPEKILDVVKVDGSGNLRRMSLDQLPVIKQYLQIKHRKELVGVTLSIEPRHEMEQQQIQKPPNHHHPISSQTYPYTSLYQQSPVSSLDYSTDSRGYRISTPGDSEQGSHQYTLSTFSRYQSYTTDTKENRRPGEDRKIIKKQDLPREVLLNHNHQVQKISREQFYSRHSQIYPQISFNFTNRPPPTQVPLSISQHMVCPQVQSNLTQVQSQMTQHQRSSYVPSYLTQNKCYAPVSNYTTQNQTVYQMPTNRTPIRAVNTSKGPQTQGQSNYFYGHDLSLKVQRHDPSHMSRRHLSTERDPQICPNPVHELSRNQVLQKNYQKLGMFPGSPGPAYNTEVDLTSIGSRNEFTRLSSSVPAPPTTASIGAKSVFLQPGIQNSNPTLGSSKPWSYYQY